MDDTATGEKPFTLSKPWIRGQAERHLKNTDAPRYARLKASGELDAYLDQKYQDVMEAAESLIAGGEFENQAWHWAVREQVFGMEPD